MAYSTVTVTPSSNVLGGYIEASRVGRVLMVSMFCSLKAMAAWEDLFLVGTLPFNVNTIEAIAYAQDTSRCVILNARGNSLYIRNKNGVALGADQWYMGQVVTSLA